MALVAAWQGTKYLVNAVGDSVKDTVKRYPLGMMVSELIMGGIAVSTLKYGWREKMTFSETATLLWVGFMLSLAGGTATELGARAVMWYVNLEKKWQSGVDVLGIGNGKKRN